jgi:hypothetical protein
VPDVHATSRAQRAHCGKPPSNSVAVPTHKATPPATAPEGLLRGEVVPGPVAAARDGLVVMFRVPVDALGYRSGGHVLVRGRGDIQAQLSAVGHVIWIRAQSRRACPCHHLIPLNQHPERGSIARAGPRTRSPSPMSTLVSVGRPSCGYPRRSGISATDPRTTRRCPNAVQTVFPSAPGGARATTVPAATGAEEAGTAGSGAKAPPRRGIPNLRGKPDRIAAFVPPQIRYTLPGQR